ncbi:auxin-responsive protein SAUR50-like [Camellia sinensis]|uniref:Uncharacterized protein n=1 Tax=Camellia sinensis var. sinensis TaxID=542762 RepID=A0A4S4DN53_CAMSN|nr:auxin-responsive protein SAUR50-like [Camellia sinensis]THG04433.1 hypothetical protein TEA_003281 [Camellia sinensis var. sinensis]
MDSLKKPNKISEIVRLQQILKKWKKLATTNKTTTTIKRTASSSSISNNNNGGSKSIKFLKKTLSFSDYTSINSTNEAVPKGFLAVCVGKELKRFIIPTEYLGHQAFQILLREAEEEFGFEQEGVLKIPCEVPVFEKILKMVQHKRPQEPEQLFFLHSHSGFNNNMIDNEDDNMNFSITNGCYSSPDCELTPPSHHPQLCR